ncbi:MAG TPA: hypothetical protein GX499_05350 [Clostridiales bacterium]|nr:hypothetical protein [Clostridiales bacterium]
MNVVDILLRMDIPQPQTKQYKHKRLSRLAGEDVIFTIQEIPYSRVAEIRRMHGDSEDLDLHIVLAGLKDPDPKNPDLNAKYGAATPAELLKKLLLPGEITDLSRQIEKLSGYRVQTLEEIKKN